MAAERGFTTIAGVLVNPDLFTRSYACDVRKYGCTSMCCYRSCIVHPDEAKRVEAHLDSILAYLSPENREAVKQNGGVLAKCDTQCPAGCVIHEDEARAIGRNFGGQAFRCVMLFNNDCALLYSTPDGNRYCAVHSYAMANNLDWEEFKFTDCVQYPLSFYSMEDGTPVLSIQDTPYLSHIPCLKDPAGEPIYKGQRRTIERLLGADFYRELASYAERKVLV